MRDNTRIELIGKEQVDEEEIIDRTERDSKFHQFDSHTILMIPLLQMLPNYLSHQ